MVHLESISPVLPMGETILQKSQSSALPAAAPGLILLGLSFNPCSAGDLMAITAALCLIGLWLRLSFAQLGSSIPAQEEPSSAWSGLRCLNKGVKQAGAPGCITIWLPVCSERAITVSSVSFPPEDVINWLWIAHLEKAIQALTL